MPDRQPDGGGQGGGASLSVEHTGGQGDAVYVSALKREGVVADHRAHDMLDEGSRHRLIQGGRFPRDGLGHSISIEAVRLLGDRERAVRRVGHLDAVLGEGLRRGIQDGVPARACDSVQGLAAVDRRVLDGSGQCAIRGDEKPLLQEHIGVDVGGHRDDETFGVPGGEAPVVISEPDLLGKYRSRRQDIRFDAGRWEATRRQKGVALLVHLLGSSPVDAIREHLRGKQGGFPLHHAPVDAEAGPSMELLERPHDEGLVLVPQTKLIPASVGKKDALVQHEVCTLGGGCQDMSRLDVPELVPDTVGSPLEHHLVLRSQRVLILAEGLCNHPVMSKDRAHWQPRQDVGLACLAGLLRGVDPAQERSRRHRCHPPPAWSRRSAEGLLRPA